MLSRKEVESMVNRDRLPEWLPYRFYDEENGLFIHQDNSIGMFFELSPAPFSGDSQINALRSFYELDWPKDTVIQVMLFADSYQDEVLNKYLNLRKNQLDDFLSGWSEKFCSYLQEHKHTGISKDTPVPFRNFRTFIMFKFPIANMNQYDSEVHRVRSMGENVTGGMQAAHIKTSILDAKEFIHLTYRFLNPGKVPKEKNYNPDQPIAEQVVDAETELKVEANALRADDWFIKVKTPRVYCPEPSPYHINQILGNLIDGSNQSQIPCPFLLTLNIIPQDAKNQIERKANIVMAQKKMTALAPKLNRKKQEYAHATEQIEEGEKYIWGYLSVVLFAEDEEKLKKSDKMVEAIFAKQQFQLQDERWLHLPLFLYALPFGPHPAGLGKLKRFEPVSTNTLAVCSPIQADWRGTATPAMLFISRRGQVMNLDLRDSDTNYNCYIAAQSGAGKSFLTNYMTLNYLSLGGQVFIIDIGGSYKKLCEKLGGQYIQFSPDSDLSMNIFSTLDPQMFQESEDAESMFIMLTRILAQMAKPHEKVTAYENKILQKALRNAISTAAETKKSISVDLIINELQQMSDELEERDLQDRRKSDLAEMLEPYSSRGVAGKWFNKPLNVDFNSNFVVLELEELNANPDLREVVLLMIMTFIDKKMYFGDRSIPKMVIMDEAWQLLQGSNTAEFIEHGYRRIRKYGGSYVTITQSILDFFRKGNEEVGLALLSNSAFKFLLSQKEEDINRATKEDKMIFSEFEKTLAKSVHTVAGKYSEIFVKTESSFGIARLFVDRFSGYLFNTKATIVEFLERKQKEGMSLEEAINTAIEENVE